jgi:hypothetical protein
MSMIAGILLTLVPWQLAQAPQSGDAPEISRSVGAPGGVLIFWPRIVPGAQAKQTRSLALALQGRLKALVEETLPGRKLEVRPEPERVCPRAGCQATTVGVLIARRGEGCVVVAMVSRPGKSPARLIPWVGKVSLKKEWVPFREHPESHLSIKDFARCDQILAGLDQNRKNVSAAIRAAMVK